MKVPKVGKATSPKVSPKILLENLPKCGIRVLINILSTPPQSVFPTIVGTRSRVIHSGDGKVSDISFHLSTN